MAGFVYNGVTFRHRGWTVPALTSVLGGLALAAPTWLAVRIVDRPSANTAPVVRYEPGITPQASTTQASPVSSWPAPLRLALRLGLLVSEPTLNRSS